MYKTTTWYAGTGRRARRPTASSGRSRRSGEVLGTSQIVLPVLDNTHLAYVEPLVRPAYRRRGVGSTLLDATVELVRDAGRTTMIAEVNLPLIGPSEALGFMTKRGFETGLLDIHRMLELPLDGRTLSGLAAAVAPHHSDYRIVLFGDVLPEEFMDGYCALNTAFNAEAPMGTLDVLPEAWDSDRVRKAEARRRAQGRHTCSAVAVAADGSLAGLTEMVISDQQPEIGWQSGTLVLKEHRGHRLGMALKVANLRSYQERFPTVETVHSWNAEDNGAMVAINDRLGFRPVERLSEMQRKL